MDRHQLDEYNSTMSAEALFLIHVHQHNSQTLTEPARTVEHSLLNARILLESQQLANRRLL